jgi:hypothetical protein
MPVTLAQAKLNVQDALTMGIIDEFRKDSFLMDNMVFDQCVSPTGGGSTLTYGYTRLVTQPDANFRAVNEEYTPATVEKQRYTTDLKVFGGSFEIDRIIAGMGGIVDEVALQSSQKIKAARARFADTIINGDSAINAKSFDGLDVALAGSDTEFNTGAGSTIDFTDAASIKANADAFLLEFNTALAQLDGKPTGIMGNSRMIAVLQFLAKHVGMYTETKDQWGNQVSTYNGIPLVDLGAKAGSNADVVGTDTVTGCTSLYFPRIAIDGFHAISLAGEASPVKVWLPDFTTAGAVKKGEVEMVAGCALKATKAAGVFRNIQIAPPVTP